MTLKAKIFNSLDKCMTGKELRRIRCEANMSKETLARKMKYWSWYKKRVQRLESLDTITLPPAEMQALLDALGATSL